MIGIINSADLLFLKFMFDNTISVLIEMKFVEPISYPKDCEALAAIICEKIKSQLNASTLK
jgi:hypothetical protein